MKKKILIAATYFPPSGGIGVFRITKFVKYLKRNNYDPIIVTVDNKYCINYDESFLDDIKDVKIYRLDFQCKDGKVDKAFSKTLKEQLPKIIKKETPDIMLLTGGPFKILPIGRYIYNKYKIPYIIDLRDPWSLQKNSGTTFKTKLKCNIIRKYQALLEKYTFKKAKCICVVNDTMKEQYEKKYPNYNFKVITNGYDEDDFKNIKAQTYKEFSIVYSGKFEVSAGFRNPDMFFKALNKIDNVKFYHIGNKENKVIELAKKNNCYDKCVFLGFKPYSEAISYMKGADLLLLLSGNEKSEQTGKIFDYMGCQSPILALTNRDNEIYKICKDLDNAYVIDNKDYKGIIKTINNLKENKKIYNNKGIKKYSREYLCQELIKIIEE